MSHWDHSGPRFAFPLGCPNMSFGQSNEATRLTLSVTQAVALAAVALRRKVTDSERDSGYEGSASRRRNSSTYPVTASANIGLSIARTFSAFSWAECDRL